MAGEIEIIQGSNGEGEKVALPKEDYEKLKAGALMQEDYTKKTQALAEERKAMQAEIEALGGAKELAEMIEALPDTETSEAAGKEINAILEKYRKGEQTPAAGAAAKTEIEKVMDKLTAIEQNFTGLQNQIKQQEINKTVNETQNTIDAVIKNAGIETETIKENLNTLAWKMLNDPKQMAEFKNKADFEAAFAEQAKTKVEEDKVLQKYKKAKTDTTPAGDRGGAGGAQQKGDEPPPYSDLKARKAWIAKKSAEDEARAGG